VTPRASRSLLGVLIGLAIVAIVVAVAGRMRSNTAGVTVAAAQFGPLDAWITTNGTIEPREPHVFRTSFATFVTSVDVVEGQTVQRGARLLTLDVAQQRVDLARAREDLVKAQNALRETEAGSRTGERAQAASDLRTAQIEVDQLRRARDATSRLVEKHAATRDELERADLALTRAEAARDALSRKQQNLDRTTQSDVDAGRLSVERARQALDLLDSQVRSADVRSPIDGTVYALPVRVGSHVDTGGLLAQVADLSAVQLRAFVDEPDLASISVGQRVEVTWSSVPNHTWIGHIERVPKNVVSRGDRMVGEVICSVGNDDTDPPEGGHRSERLIPNLDVDVRIRLLSRSHVLLVPRQAVKGDRQGRYVFVVQEGILERRAVTVDAASATTDSIADGLHQGERVVVATAGGGEVRSGMRVRVESEVP
jgi:HlyD family secretion protein